MNKKVIGVIVGGIVVLNIISNADNEKQVVQQEDNTITQEQQVDTEKIEETMKIKEKLDYYEDLTELDKLFVNLDLNNRYTDEIGDMIDNTRDNLETFHIRYERRGSSGFGDLYQIGYKEYANYEERRITEGDVINLDFGEYNYTYWKATNTQRGYIVVTYNVDDKIYEVNDGLLHDGEYYVNYTKEDLIKYLAEQSK